jgi:hypothetical protein
VRATQCSTHGSRDYRERELDEADELITQLGVEPRLERLREFDARIERATTRLANLAKMLPNRKIARDRGCSNCCHQSRNNSSSLY